MNIEYMKPNELVPYSKNAKLHPEDQVEHIANSIKMFGWTQPIVIDDRNVVVIGHGRLAAAKKLGLDQVPVVRRSDLTDEQTKALRIVDNRVAKSKTDRDLIAEELGEMLTMLGLELEEKVKMLSDLGFEY